MSEPVFIHLRVHSAYSLLEGALKIKELMELCQRHAMPAVAITDTGNLFGCLEFAMTAQKAGVQPIIGCQLGLSREGEEERRNTLPTPDRLVLLVQDERGYRNLMALSSRAYLNTPSGEPPRVSLADLEELNAGLIALTGGPAGPVGRLLLQRQRAAAQERLEQLASMFPGRLYVELMRHGLDEENAIEESQIELAYALELPLVATNECFFGEAVSYEAHDALICIAEGRYVAESNRRRLTPEHRFKTGEEMAALFADLPEAISNTVVVARRCAWFPEPVQPILPAFPTRGGRSESEELRAQAESGLEHRLETQVYTAGMSGEERAAAAVPYRERLAFEIDVIEQMGYPGYFLIVADFIKWAKADCIPVGPGRGSGAGSVVAWALTITDLDPLRWGLLFERFLNPERVSMPDFDIDFCQERRDEVIRYVQKQYGRDQVAQIITFGKLQARAALRDVGRVLQMPYPQVDRICKLVPNNPAKPVTLAQAVDGEPMLQEMRRQDEAVARLIEVALEIEGLYRHASTHAAGVVIGDRPLEEMIPLYRDPRSEMPVTQFSMKYVELAGLVKFDFLGLKTLSVIARAIDLIESTGGGRTDMATISLEDARTFDLLARAETVGVFQLESSGMRDVLRRLQADRFEDIIAVVALYRPGPMDNIPSYIRRKHGEEEPDYLHASLEGILKETYGIMIYQEQVMQIAQELAGYTLGNADLLRRAMGKKIQSEMDAQRQSFIDGAMRNGVPKGKAAEIFEQVNKFAGYGFNKSHAAAYAMVAYQTAYLKANYPVEFMAASMSFDMSNTDKLNHFRQELARLGIPLLPPDINRSGPDFEVETQPEGGKAIRYALAAIKNVGFAAMRSLAEERENGGPFASISDFARRLDHKAINKRLVESLACAGAFDSLNDNRRQLCESADAMVRVATAAADERASRQVNLFGEQVDSDANRVNLKDTQDWSQMERLRHEFDALGFYLSAHPLDAFGKSLQRLKVVSYQDLASGALGRVGRARLAGIVIGKREINSRKGNRMAFVQLSDMSGAFEVTLFSEVLSRSRELLEGGQPLMVTTSVEPQGEGEPPRLTAEDVEPLERAVATTAAGLKVYLNDEQPLQSLRELLNRDGKGRARISLILSLGVGEEAEFELPAGYRLSADVRKAIKAVPGVVTQDL